MSNENESVFVVRLFNSSAATKDQLFDLLKEHRFPVKSVEEVDPRTAQRGKKIVSMEWVNDPSARYPLG